MAAPGGGIIPGGGIKGAPIGGGKGPFAIFAVRRGY